MTWTRRHIHYNAGVPDLDPDDYVSPNKIERRVYAQKGRTWPRLTLTCWRRHDCDESGIHVSVDIKRSPRGWWEKKECMPLDLVDEVIEMLRDAKAKMGGVK